MMIKTNLKDRKRAMAFAIYEMVGSYYQRPMRLSRREEGKYYIPFLEENPKTQCYLEDQVLRFCDRTLTGQLPEILWQEETRVSVAQVGPDYQVRFQGPHYLLCVEDGEEGQTYQVYHHR